MPPTEKSPHIGDLAPEQRRNEVIAVIAAGLARLVGDGLPPLASPAENLSASAEIRLELSGETRLSVPAG